MNNLLTSVSGVNGKYSAFAYDDRGNITNNGSRSFAYNRANQLTSSGSNSYIYDAHNRRVKQIDSKGTSYSMYGYDGTLLYRETSAGGINYIYLGKKLIAKDGVVPKNAGRQHYRPFGASIEGEIDDVGFTGHKFDTDLGLSYMQQRYYDPDIGRFYSNDPVDTISHLNGSNGTHGFNRYAYANNNPYKFIDPDGRSSYNPMGMSINLQGAGKIPNNGAAMHSAMANSMNEDGGMRAAQMTAGAVAIAACNAACGVTAIGLALVSIVDGATGKSVISEGLQAAGTDKSIADGISAVVDLAGGGKGFADDVAGAAKSLVTDSAGSTLSKTATAVGNTALTQANLDSNLGKVEDAVKK